MKLQKQIKINK